MSVGKLLIRRTSCQQRFRWQVHEVSVWTLVSTRLEHLFTSQPMPVVIITCLATRSPFPRKTFSHVSDPDDLVHGIVFFRRRDLRGTLSPTFIKHSRLSHRTAISWKFSCQTDDEPPGPDNKIAALQTYTKTTHRLIHEAFRAAKHLKTVIYSTLFGGDASML